MKAGAKRALSILVACLIVLAIVWTIVLLLAAPTVDVMSALAEGERTETSRTYQLTLPRPEENVYYNLMLEARGSSVVLSAGDAVLYEYSAEEGRTVGTIYGNTLLPESAYDGPLTIRLTAADRRTDLELESL